MEAEYFSCPGIPSRPLRLATSLERAPFRDGRPIQFSYFVLSVKENARRLVRSWLTLNNSGKMNRRVYIAFRQSDQEKPKGRKATSGGGLCFPQKQTCLRFLSLGCSMTQWKPEEGEVYIIITTKTPCTVTVSSILIRSFLVTKDTTYPSFGNGRRPASTYL
jgi:hypothetical protein